MRRWFANRFAATGRNGYLAEVSFHRTTQGNGWEWVVWRGDPEQPEAEGRELTRARAMSAASKALKRLEDSET